MSAPEEIRAALRRFRRRPARQWGAQREVMAVTVAAGAGGPAVLLIRHADSSGRHPGTLGLPGGPTDRWASVSGAARGLLADTLAIHLPPESVLGLLDDYLIHSKHVITPVVLWAGPVEAHWMPGTETLAVPFAELDVEPVLVASADSDRPVIRLPLHGEWLHAPAAAVLHQFREVVLYHRPTRVSHLAPIPH
ncbi:MAG: coenzyme A pyrophosphatase [Pseudonocardiaceae bacterium]